MVAPSNVATSDGYYRWTDITFDWTKSLDNEYERRAIFSLVRRDALVDPNHPLASSGKPMELYIGEYADGKKQLCYSLRQLQYLQHYIYEKDLTNPGHPDNAKDPAKDPEDDEKPVRRVPLPAGLIPKESFKSITPFTSLEDARKMDNKLRKANKKKSPEVPSPAPTPSAARPASPSSTPAEPLNYFQHVQQAVVLARLGGVVAAHRSRGELTESAPELTTADLAAGRGLFIAPYVREYDGGDGDLILKDVGFHALCFPEDPNKPGTYFEYQDHEHWLVEEERGFAGEPSPYLFKKAGSTGGSLPFPRNEVKPRFKRKLVDLWNRAGNGPVYILIHSTDYDASNLFLLGLDITEIQEDIGTTYSDPASNGNKFWIDTARLFGEVEKDQPGDLSDAEHLTTRSLISIMTLLHGPAKEAAPGDNAGNMATFTMKVFMKLVQNWEAKTFDAARAWFAPKLRASSVPPTPPSVAREADSSSVPPTESSSSLASVSRATSTSAVTNLGLGDLKIGNADYSSVMGEDDDDDDDNSDNGGFVPMVLDKATGKLVPYVDEDDE